MIKKLSDINLEELKKNHLDLYYFGLGFIQLKIDKTHRLHFYDPSLPMITGVEEIHNHRYDFKSLVLSGALENTLFEIVYGNEFSLSKENCQPGTPDFHSQKILVGIKQTLLNIHRKGDDYFMDHQWFHRVQAQGETITFLTRTDYKKDLADVVRPAGEEKICPFSLVISKEELWSKIEGILTRALEKEKGP